MNSWCHVKLEQPYSVGILKNAKMKDLLKLSFFCECFPSVGEQMREASRRENQRESIKTVLRLGQGVLTLSEQLILWHAIWTDAIHCLCVRGSVCVSACGVLVSLHRWTLCVCV